ncbi:MAG TPA: alkaline phosphatase family protein [Polyangia bacterium]|jgi:arylsulfatase A-like enzyme|nr:alkaline phosphatase family protein [Polyangia bacterium]
MPRRSLLALLLLASACRGSSAAPPHTARVIQIDIDDHGLAGLWMANAPNLMGLIQRGTLAYSRVVIPTHSNQNNMALLTGQYPDGDDVPANSWLARDGGFFPPVNLPGISSGNYLLYDQNPLLVRGDSVYRAVHRAGLRSAYFGELPPFEAGADEVHLTIVGTPVLSTTLTADLASQLLTGPLHYPPDVAARYHLDGPGTAGEDVVHFTIHDAATFLRNVPSKAAIPDYMFVWDFLALDDDPTSVSGASGPDIIKSVEQYDAAIGDLLSALTELGVLDETNIVFTLDHGKVDTHNQVALGTTGTTATRTADGQLGALVTTKGAALGIAPTDYAILNEDGDAQIYAAVAGAGTASGAARQQQVTQALLSLIQSGAIEGLDVTRTMTADGAMGTRRFHDFRASGPYQPDIMVFPVDDWTLNQVDATNTAPGPFQQHGGLPYGRHGGFSVDELYVPLIMAGPAFKQGVLIPHPVVHPEVGPTAMQALAGPQLRTSARGAVAEAFVGDPGEAIPLPTPLSSTRQLALDAAGFGAAATLVGPAAASAVIIDVAGLYDEEAFVDPALAAAAAPLRALAATGTRFEDVWTRSRDWPVTEYQMLTGGYPIQSPWIAMADDDPAQTILPGPGLLAMPPPGGRVASQTGYAIWRTRQPFADETILAVARAAGFTTTLIGQPDAHAFHIPAGDIDVTAIAGVADAAATVGTVLAAHARALVVVALGGARTSDRHSTAARTELASLSAAVRDIARVAGSALVVVTSRGGTPIDDDASDFYGPGSSRHVPMLVIGPNVRAGIVSGQPGTPADVPATVLFGLGLASKVDLADGTQPVSASGALVPSSAFEGHALLRAFDVTTMTAAPQ